MTWRLLLLGLFSCSTFAQGDAHFAFDAASIKIAGPPGARIMPHVGCKGGPETRDPGLWICENALISMLIQVAYDIKAFQLTSSRGLGGGLFDITARVPPRATKDQFRLMVQDLLAERFRFASHWETKEMPVYDMTVEKGGPKFSQIPEEPDPGAGGGAPGQGVEVPRRNWGKDGYPDLPPEFEGAMLMVTPTRALRARLQLPHGTMEKLAAMLSIRLARPVIDGTGLKDTYRISIYWQPDEAGLGGSTDPAGAMPQADRGPSLEIALQEQLGLKLASKKDRVKVLMVDHVDSSPSGN